MFLETEEKEADESGSPKLDELLGREDFHENFDTEAYLRDFYSQMEEPAMKFVLTFLPNIVARMPKGGRLLDFGAGPTIHVSLCFRRCVDEVHMADFLPQNRLQLIKWAKDESDFDWTVVKKQIAHQEGDMCAIDTMEEEARRKVVITIYCIEYTCKTGEEYEQAIKNVAKLVKIGGYFILGGILEETWCQFGGKKFGCLYTTEDFVMNTMKNAGIEVEDPTKSIYFMFNGMFLLCGQKIR